MRIDTPSLQPDSPLLSTAERASILVVDDQATNIQMLFALLGPFFDIRMATQGEDALKLVQTAPPDLILLDIQMPGLSGYDVCRQLQAHEDTRHIPIIFITAHESPEDETECFRLGAVDFITKPFNPDVVKARVRTHVLLKRQSDLLRDLVFIDGLTGVGNRRRFDEALTAEWRHGLRSGDSLSVILIDIDHFKQYNDLYGHIQGDACLRRLAQTLASQVNRSHDLVARYGGEEFICLLPECDARGARAIAEAMRCAVEHLGLAHESMGSNALVTISAGVSSVVPTEHTTAADLLALADQQLYRAKSQGRNRVSG